MKQISVMSDDELMTATKELGAPYDVLKQIKKDGKLPVKLCSRRSCNTQDAALMMALGADGVFVGSGIFKSENPEKFAKAIVQATENYTDYTLIGELSKELGSAMTGLDVHTMSLEERMAERGW